MDGGEGLAQIASSLRPLDWILLAVSLLLFVRGLFSGLAGTLFSIGGLIAGGFLAVRYTPEAVGILGKEGDILYIAGIFLFIFVVVYLVFLLAGKLLEALIRKAGMSVVSRVGGGIANVLIFWVVLYFALKELVEANEQWKNLLVENSLFAAYILGGIY